jgi:hypothetical protein
MIADKLFINLRILSKIPKNGRITKSNDGIVSIEYDSMLPLAVKRFISNDSRKQSVFEINSIVSECIEAMCSLSNSKYMVNVVVRQGDPFYKTCEELELVLTELEAAKRGIENLKFTYANDINIVSQLDVIILKVTGALKDYTSKLDNFKKYLPSDETQAQTQTHTHKQEPEIELVNLSDIDKNTVNCFN